MRRPSDRAELWSTWRRRVAGERLRFGDEPQCGRYMAKRNGQHVAVQIDVEQEIDEATGELLSDETYVAFVNGEKFTDPLRVGEIWQRCAGKPLSDEEFRRVMNLPRITDLTRQVIT